jgi:murein L,D-transpeptidase YafK
MRFLKLHLFLYGSSFIIVVSLLALSISTLAQTSHTTKRSDAAIETWTPHLTEALEEKDLRLGKPVFLRLVKTTSVNNAQGYLEAFVEADDRTFKFFKRWDICAYSGTLGPKLKEGDGQSPEGFYFVKPRAMNPNSSYHLSFNLGFPNVYDRAHGRTGSFLMIHGDCVSIGCYAMTDDGIEEIYTLMDAAFRGGQPFIRVHIFPFPMTDANLLEHSNNSNAAFWKNLKTGWEVFEQKKRPPNVTVSDKRYIFD